MADWRWYVCKSGYLACRVVRRKKPTCFLGIEQIQAELDTARSGKQPVWDHRPTDWRILRPSARSDDVRDYPVGEHPQLFRTFANTDPSLLGILKFANQYGLLETASREEDQIPNPISPKVLWGSELVSDWIEEIFRMRWTVEAWDFLCNERWQKLASLFSFAPRKQRIIYDAVPQVRTLDLPMCATLSSCMPFARLDLSERDIASMEYTRLRNPNRLQDELSEATYLFIAEMVNRGLRSLDEGLSNREQDKESRASLSAEQGAASVKVRIHPTGAAFESGRMVFPSLQWDRATRRLSMQLAPDNLIGALWLQLARAVLGRKSYPTCPTCGETFEVSREAKRRRSSTFCGGACRSANRRQKIAKARRLALDGRTPSEIAESLESTVRTVRGWIRK